MHVLQGYCFRKKVIHYSSNFSILNEYVMKFVNGLQSLPILLNITPYFVKKIISQNCLSMDLVLFYGMSFNNKWYFLSQDNIFFTSSLRLIVLVTKICPKGEKVLVHLETKVFYYLWYSLQHRHINHAIVTQLYLPKNGDISTKLVLSTLTVLCF